VNADGEIVGEPIRFYLLQPFFHTPVCARSLGCRTRILV
jgi:hypothetical protein